MDLVRRRGHTHVVSSQCEAPNAGPLCKNRDSLCRQVLCGKGSHRSCEAGGGDKAETEFTALVSGQPPRGVWHPGAGWRGSPGLPHSGLHRDGYGGLSASCPGRERDPENYPAFCGVGPCMSSELSAGLIPTLLTSSPRLAWVIWLTALHCPGCGLTVPPHQAPWAPGMHCWTLRT